MFQLHYLLFIISIVVKVFAVPPSVCRAEFRWDDCGKPPKPVMYYWKQGSRCEIGYWRGCLPNPNMFADEYECINTCVFADRPARSETEEPEPETTTYENSTDITNDTSFDTTAAALDEHSTLTSLDNSVSPSDDSSPTSSVDPSDPTTDSTTESTTETTTITVKKP